MRWISILLGLIVFAADWWSKTWAQETLPGASRTVVEGLFRLRYVQNEGIAFGLFHSLDSAWKPALLTLAALMALAVVGYYIHKTPVGQRLLFLSFGLLLGGILGNFSDRLLNGFVVDFLELHWRDLFIWPTFNVADAAITCGVGILILETFLGAGGKSQSSASKPAATPPASGSYLLPFLLLLASQATLPGPVSANDATQAVLGLEARYETVQTLSARFRQLTTDRGIQHEESGVLKMKKPDRMYWEYLEPSRKIFVANGRESVFYDVEQKQAFESELDPNDESPLLFLMGRASLSRDFRISLASQEAPLSTDHLLVRLDPHRPRADFDHLLIEIDPSHQISRLSVIDVIGHRNDYILSEIRENLPIPDKAFQVKIPKDVERIH